MGMLLPKILMVDDDTNMLLTLHAMLGSKFDLRVARTGNEALRLARIDQPDAVLLDIEMPEMDGYETCQQFKADATLAEIPIVFLTSHSHEDFEVRGLNVGAADFIIKPPRGPAVVARVDNLVRMKQLSDRIRSEAMSDGLTGFANRKHFDVTLRSEWLRAVRTARPLGLVMADVDHFKAYNDRYGHVAGDGCLRAVAQALKSALHRPGDLLARYGGEEFVLLLPDTDAAGARKVAAAAAQAVSAVRLLHEASSSGHVTVSLGATAIDATCASWAPWSPKANVAPSGTPLAAEHEHLVLAADRALYAAKAHGRNDAWFLAIDDHEFGNRAARCSDAGKQGPPAGAVPD